MQTGYKRQRMSVVSMRRNQVLQLMVCCLGIACFSTAAYALPFNDDMVHDQYKTGEVMRDAPEGSVPIGAAERYVKDRPEAVLLKNPVPRSQSSVKNGERLFAVNCVPCHGRYTGLAHPQDGTSALFEKPINPSVAGATAGPLLVSKSYIEDPTRTDGHIFSYIYFGGLAIMPRYGYKLAPREQWDIVNYIRSIQDDFKNVMRASAPPTESNASGANSAGANTGAAASNSSATDSAAAEG